VKQKPKSKKRTVGPRNWWPAHVRPLNAIDDENMVRGIGNIDPDFDELTYQETPCDPLKDTD